MMKLHALRTQMLGYHFLATPQPLPSKEKGKVPAHAPTSLPPQAIQSSFS